MNKKQLKIFEKWKKSLKTMSKNQLIAEVIEQREISRGNYDHAKRLEDKFRPLAIAYCLEVGVCDPLQ